jgi:linoleoyl-CoA desaturase
MSKVTFNNKNSVFYTDLKSAVDNYFQQRQLKKTGNWKLFLKTGVLIPLAIMLYVAIMFFHLPIALVIVLGGLLGFTLASIGFNVMHDACHGSYSSRKWANNVMGLTMNALGGNAYIWKQKHNIIHHTYTNVDGMDDDIAKSPLIRQCDTQKWVPMHRIQHIYLPLVYSITSLAWALLTDFMKYFSGKVHQTGMKKMDTKEHIIFWVSKILYLTVYVLIPLFFLGPIGWLLFFVGMHVIEGLTLAIVFQLAHVVEHTEFEVVTDDPKMIETEWAVHQVKTTANFANNNKIISWLVGGLNFQIEHHLFPKVSHVHYPALSKIVKKVCEMHGMPYHQYPTMSSAVASHFRFMKQLGRKPQLATAH